MQPDILLSEPVLWCSSCGVLLAICHLDESGRCSECASSSLPLPPSHEVLV